MPIGTTERPDLDEVRSQLERTEAEVKRLRDELESRRHIVDILHDVMGNLSSDEIFHMLVRRLARALDLAQSSVVLAKLGSAKGSVVATFEAPTIDPIEIPLAMYPEIRQALETQKPVLIGDVSSHPLYDEVRQQWEAEGIHVNVRSLIVLPFELDTDRSGVFLLRRSLAQPRLNEVHVEFARTVVNSALMAIQRAQAVEETRADNLRLEALAELDPLTELLNRRGLTTRLLAELERVRRYDAPMAVLMLDLDDFKQINDTYGHALGDAVLTEFAGVLQRAARSVDVVARYGGDEFVIVLPETTDEGATAFAERLLDRIQAHAYRGPNGSKLALSASIGLATFPAAGIDGLDTLLQAADVALYRAKQEGRNRVRS